jgi:hypothetical protein
MDARCGYRRIVHGEQCERRRYAVIVTVFSIVAIGSLVTWAWGVRAAKLAWHKLANANLQRRDAHAPRRLRNVTGDAV